MKIVIASDNHGDKKILERIINDNPDGTLFLHAGDSEMNGYELAPFISVRGNCDHNKLLPLFQTFDTPAGVLFLCHGHHHKISFKKIAKIPCQIFIHGHYHIHYQKQNDNQFIASPGSTSFPRDKTKGTYLIITFEGEQPIFTFKNLN